MQTTAATKTKVPVTERALVQRIKRKLKANNWSLRKATRGRSAFDSGPYYVLNLDLNAVQFHYKQMGPEDLLALGRELDAVHPWEELAQ